MRTSADFKEKPLCYGQHDIRYFPPSHKVYNCNICGWRGRCITLAKKVMDDDFNTNTFGPLPDPARNMMHTIIKAGYADAAKNDTIKGDVSVTTDPVSPYKGSANPKQAYGDKKIPLHLMPPIAEILTCVALREGAIKYGAWNFRDTRVELMTYVGAIKRHLAAIIDGEWIDPDDVVMPDGTIVDLPKKPHIAGLLASAAILADAYYNGNLVDNRPAPGKASELLKDFMAP